MARNPNSYNAFVRDFTLPPHQQSVWMINHPVWFFAMGAGGGLYVLRWLTGLPMGFILGLPLADVLGLTFVGIGGVILIADLGRPGKFLNALRNYRRSWISVGAICDFVLLILGTLYVLPQLSILDSLPFSWLPWTTQSMLGTGIQAVAGIAAVVVMVYAGFALASPLSIPFWNTRIVPAQFLVYSLSSAYAIFFINETITGSLTGLAMVSGSVNKSLELVFAGLLALCLLTTLGHVFMGQRVGSGAAAMDASRRTLLRGELKWHFVIGTLVFGLALPFLLSIFSYFLSGWIENAALLFAGILALEGAFMVRFTIVKAGVYSPIWEGLFSQGTEFSKLQG